MAAPTNPIRGSATTRVLFVCLGNICRSPAAEALLEHLARQRGVDGVVVDSAGTSRSHEGERPHELACAEAARRGVPLDHRSRPVVPSDFELYDLLVAMDRANERVLRTLAPPGFDPARIVRLGSFAPDAAAAGVGDVADPWGRPPEAFAAMYDHLELLCGAFLDDLSAAPTT